MDDNSWAVRYQALNHPEADPDLESSWSQYVFLVDSQLDAIEVRDQWARVYAGNPNIRDIQIVYAPKITWTVYNDQA
ncbi:hypothetical protein [Mycobacterium heckeshornense]|uniref:hypothetical protein n=1 Tax=Mycobacterium heckeshornense TaxID=110505 RepID=UPI000662C329|nr:hypothetical protein [Mycobacterium heckeshornense]